MVLTSRKIASTWGAVGAIMAFISVAMGAFAAHGLKAYLTDDQLSIVDTAAKYQMYHAITILSLAVLMIVANENSIIVSRIRLVCASLFIGIILFSGSLYLLALTTIKWFAFITPVGGLLFLIGWVYLVFVFLSIRKR